MRILRALYEAARVFLQTVWRVTRQLFHEITAMAFAVFALAGVTTAWREWHNGMQRWTIALAIGFATMMAWFAATSFLRAKRVR